MQYKKYNFLYFLLVFCCQYGVAQNAKTDQNGRTAQQIAIQKKINTLNNNENIAQARNGDEEDAGPGEDKDVGTYPLPSGETLTGNAELDALSLQLQDLISQQENAELTTAQFQADLDDIKKSLQMCCGGGAALNENGEAAHLLQNAPNPFSVDTDIQYFLPENVYSASLQIRNLKGIIIKSFPVTQTGIGSINVGEHALLSGSYIYTLEVDGQIVDSKIMILTK